MTPPLHTATISARQRALFQQHIERAYRAAQAVTPAQRLVVLDEVERVLRTQGTLPTEHAVISVPVSHPAVQAALSGQSVTLGGRVIGGHSSVTARLQGLGTGQKFMILGGLGVGMVVLFLLIIVLVRRPIAPVVAVVPTPSVGATPSPAVTASPTSVATATAYSIAFISGDAAAQVYDPASLEVAGFSYILSLGQVRNGEWTPTGAEWLAGTTLRRVVAIPYEPSLVAALTPMTTGTVIHLRLRNGEVVPYQVVSIGRVPRQQIEVMVDRQPSIAVILHGEATPDRWVLVGTAIQQVPLQGAASTLLPSLPEATLPVSGTRPAITPPAITLTPTPSVSSVSTVSTDTLPLTHTAAGLQLEVHSCQRLNRIGDQTPPQNKQQFVTCELTLTALPTNTTAMPYSAEAFGLTEQVWMTTSTDWWPPSISVSSSLRSGTLTPGGQTRGRIGGLITRSGTALSGTGQPVLVWEQANTRYLITLPETVWN